jgi:vitamin-K-epoxide reductase (warfarin-sensitive)
MEQKLCYKGGCLGRAAINYSGMRANAATKLFTFFIVILCLAGVVVSSLALREHYNTGSSPCSINDVWDCGTVNHSPYAVLFGVPVAVIGIAGYLLLAALAVRFPRITVVFALLGMIFALRLTWIEWKILEVWCIYCVSSQVIIAGIFLLTSIQALLMRSRRSME